MIPFACLRRLAEGLGVVVVVDVVELVVVEGVEVVVPGVVVLVVLEDWIGLIRNTKL